MATSAPVATRYRTGGRREKAIRIAAIAANPRHCQSEWSSAQPSACSTSAESQLSSLAIAAFLVRIQNTAELFDLFGRGTVPRQGMHHELAGGAFENTLQHIDGEL